MIERERRFLVGRLPNEMSEGSRIDQAYLTTVPVSVRVRHQDDRHVLTIKAGSGLSRTEIERDLDPDEFDVLWAIADELRITKQRHLVPLDDGLTAEVDVFEGDLAGHRIVEVEFESLDQAEAFDPPDWFGREITDNGRYTNASLAKNGWPDSE